MGGNDKLHGPIYSSSRSLLNRLTLSTPPTRISRIKNTHIRQTIANRRHKRHSTAHRIRKGVEHQHVPVTVITLRR